MKSMIMALVFAFSGLASAYTTGDKIHFQRDSVYVNSLYNKSLCLNSNGSYEAVVRTCLKYRREDGDRNCVKWGKKKIYQPASSTRMRCTQRRGDKCVSYARVAYNQRRTRYVKHYRNNDDFKYEQKVTIRRCR